MAKKIKKKKRRVRLPKNYDPNVAPDPERWLPKHERKGFKKMRNKKGRVTQGGEAEQGSVTRNQASTVNQEVSTSTAMNKKKKNQKKRK